ncbi:MAG TPA: thioredoxin family protein [Polyangiaceae bacterium]|nr:thioredoxin family protein [Polyangiaceae bacterium]
MARTESKIRALGWPLPAAELPNVVSAAPFSLRSMIGRPAVVAFICNHCPFVKNLKPALAEFGRYCAAQGVNLVAISSNDVSNYPQDSPEKMREDAQEQGYSFPYLFDDSQAVAKAFDAACTPEFYVFDSDGLLAYHGQFDDSRPNNGIVPSGSDLRAAVDALLQGERPNAVQKQSIGCNIKWKN